MTTPILDAMKALVSTGTYKSILQKWGITEGAISHPSINGAIS
jgi:ABC-type amino acid transport substrate-binding protein